MSGLKEVRNRIKSVGSTQQITKAMKMVAAAKLRRAQDGIMQLRPYSYKLSEIINNLNSADTDSQVIKQYSVGREAKKVWVVVVTSDRGLCGGFNSNVIKAVTATINEKYTAQKAAGTLQLITIGKKGTEFMQKRDVKVEAKFATLFSTLNFDNVKLAAEYLMTAFSKGEVDVIDVVYNEFKNVATQIVKVEQFLPLTSVVPTSKLLTKKTVNDYIFEPSQSEILDELIPKSLKVKFYSFLLESNASEQGARMTAMEKATENAGEMLKALKLTYNRTRQAAITKEILEIVGGAEALSK